MNEDVAELYSRIFGMECVGLRYFNVFGPRQDPNGAYAAVIPRWFDAFARGERPVIYGDGETSRDFCYIGNVVEANLLAARTADAEAFGAAFNIACEDRTTLNELFRMIRDVSGVSPDIKPIYEDFRPGDVRHSLASVERARTILGYEPRIKVGEGLRLASAWYLRGTRT
jgi:UDP-N-acetylglucosamine 4-epimerase